MIAHVQVAGVLREAVQAPYTNLVTRPTGVLVRRHIEATLQDGRARVAVLDFTDIALLDCSCADEIVAKLAFGADGCTPRPILLRGLRDDQREAIDYVLVRCGTAVIAVDGLDAESVGPLDPALHRLLADALADRERDA